LAKIKVEVEVSKETHELCVGLVEMTKAVVLAQSDGWQVGSDLPAIALAAFGQMAAIEGVDKIGAEIKEDPAAFTKAIALGLADVYSVLRPEEVVPEVEAPAEPA